MLGGDPVDTAAQGDDSLGVGGELFHVGTRAVVHAVDVRVGDQLDEVLVAGEVPGDEGLVVDLVLRVVLRAELVLGDIVDVVGALAVALGALGLGVVVDEVDLAADQRLDAGLFAGAVEVDGAEEVAVVGQGGHVELLAALHVAVDPGTAIEQGVVGMAVQVDERLRVGIGHGKRLRKFLFSRQAAKAQSFNFGFPAGRLRIGRYRPS